MRVNYLRQIDAVAGMKSLPAESIDMVVTSPPYDSLRTNGGIVFEFEPIAHQLLRVIKPGGVIAWVVEEQIVDWCESGTVARQRLYFKDLGFKLYNTIIVDPSFQNGCPWARYGRAPQYVIVLSKGKPKYIRLIYDRPNKEAGKLTKAKHRNPDGTMVRATTTVIQEFGKRRNVWRYQVGAPHCTRDVYAYGHSAIMPEQLAEDLIVSWCPIGGIVLDPMCGAATTCKMAAMNYRRWIGFEPYEKHFEISQRRMSDIWACQCGLINHGTDAYCLNCQTLKQEKNDV